MVMKKPRGCACPTRESSIRYGSCDLLSSKLAYKNLNEDYVFFFWEFSGKNLVHRLGSTYQYVGSSPNHGNHNKDIAHCGEVSFDLLSSGDRDSSIETSFIIVDINVSLLGGFWAWGEGRFRSGVMWSSPPPSVLCLFIDLLTLFSRLGPGPGGGVFRETPSPSHGHCQPDSEWSCLLR